jgi:hypothetical protein
MVPDRHALPAQGCSHKGRWYKMRPARQFAQSIDHPVSGHRQSGRQGMAQRPSDHPSGAQGEEVSNRPICRDTAFRYTLHYIVHRFKIMVFTHENLG